MLFKHSNPDSSTARPSETNVNTSWTTQRPEKADRLSWEEGEKPDKDDEELSVWTAQLFYSPEADRRKEEEKKRRQQKQEEEARYYAEQSRKAQERREHSQKRRAQRRIEHEEVTKALSAHHIDETDVKLLSATPENIYVDPLAVQKPFTDNFNSKPEVVYNFERSLREGHLHDNAEHNSNVHEFPNKDSNVDRKKSDVFVHSRASKQSHGNISREHLEHCENNSMITEERSHYELVLQRSHLTQAFSELQQSKANLADKQTKLVHNTPAVKQANQEVVRQKEKVHKMEDKLLTTVMKRKLARWRGENEKLQNRKIRSNLYNM